MESESREDIEARVREANPDATEEEVQELVDQEAGASEDEAAEGDEEESTNEEETV